MGEPCGHTFIYAFLGKVRITVATSFVGCFNKVKKSWNGEILSRFHNFSQNISCTGQSQKGLLMGLIVIDPPPVHLPFYLPMCFPLPICLQAFCHPCSQLPNGEVHAGDAQWQYLWRPQSLYAPATTSFHQHITFVCG